jgi:hypothetical protein
LTAADVSDPASQIVQAIDFLVQDALDDSSGTRAARLAQALTDVNPVTSPDNPSIYVWKESLGARTSLARVDTTAAIAALQRASRRLNEPYGAFLPLASAPVQRRLLASLLEATHAPMAAIAQARSSFERSWSIADALFVPPVANGAHTGGVSRNPRP